MKYRRLRWARAFRLLDKVRKQERQKLSKLKTKGNKK